MKSGDHKNAEEGHHDDCDDCKRQRAQNQTLISIYQRLQAANGQSKTLRRSLEKHKHECIKATEKFQQFACKLKQIPSQSKATIEVKNLGYEFAQTLIQQIIKNKTKRDNEQTKRNLIGMNPEKPTFTSKFSINRSFSINARYEIANKNIELQSTQNSMINRKMNQQEENDVLRRSAPEQKMSTIRSTDSTNTTAFFSFQNTEKEKSKMDGLNLWLYNPQLNKSIEQQMYTTRKSHRRANKSMKARTPILLPIIKTARNKF